MEIPNLPMEEKKVEEKVVKTIPKKRSPMDMFFALGPKDPKRKADFDYYLFWIIFVTFSGLAVNYFRLVFMTGDLAYLGWGIVISIFAYFNFSNLKAMREMRKMLREADKMQQTMQPMKVESKEEMLGEFK